MGDKDGKTYRSKLLNKEVEIDEKDESGNTQRRSGTLKICEVHKGKKEKRDI